jgi:hypothetical protein
MAIVTCVVYPIRRHRDETFDPPRVAITHIGRVPALERAPPDIASA